MNQAWHQSPGQLLLTDNDAYPSKLSTNGYYTYPGVLGQSRGWQNVPGMTGPPGWQVGECVDEWTGGACTHHYLTLGGGPMTMTVPEAETWCNKNTSCHGFTYLTAEADKTTSIYFRDETQIFFMDSQVGGLSGHVGSTKYTSRVQKARAPPLSPATSGVQVWVKDVGDTAAGPALALLLVNLGQTALPGGYSIPLTKLPPGFAKGLKGPELRVRDVWGHRDVDTGTAVKGGALNFAAPVAPHDSVFWVLTRTTH